MSAVARVIALLLAALGLGGGAVHAGRVPAGVTSIRISAAGVAMTVTDRASVQQIARWFDELPQAVPRRCPLMPYYPPDLTFDFLRGSGVVLHAVDHAPGGACPGSITYDNIGQVKYAPLADDNFAARVLTLIGGRIPSAVNRSLSVRDAAYLLQLAALPRGSHATERAQRSMTPSSVGFGRTWKVRMSLDAVFAFERAHRPHGSRIGYTSISTPLHGKDSSAIEFTFPAIGGRVSSRVLDVNITRLANSWTSIRISSQDVWAVARSANEVVPSGVRTIEIRKGSVLTHRVASTREVATIVHWFDALPLPPLSGANACDGTEGPLLNAQTETIAFLDGSGQVVARAKSLLYGVDLQVCFPIEFSAGGHRFPPLLGGDFLIRVEKLLR